MNAFMNMSAVSKVITVVIAIALIAGGVAWYTHSDDHTGGEAVICTADAMQCPDATWVGRSGPNCQFACPSAASAGGSLQGTVVAP